MFQLRDPRKEFRGGVFSLVMGLLVFVVTGARVVHGVRSTNWPSVEGRILSSGVKVNDRRVDGRSTSRTTKGAATYRYTVDGKTYENDVVQFGQVFTVSREHAKRIASRHPVGPGKIYYDPGNPARSVLEPGLHALSLIPPAAGLLFTLLGVWMIRKSYF